MKNGKEARQLIKNVFMNLVLHQIAQVKEVMRAIGWTEDAIILQNLQDRFTQFTLTNNEHKGY